jgi:hypothetical protein
MCGNEYWTPKTKKKKKKKKKKNRSQRDLKSDLGINLRKLS